MAIHVFCPTCKSSYGLEVLKCAKCGTKFGRNKKYRVVASVNGKRMTKVLDNLTLAREAEGALKTDMVRGQLDILKQKKAPTLNEVWSAYLPWAKEHKRTWRSDESYYKGHIEPRFGNKGMDAIWSFDVEKMKSELRKEKSDRGKLFAKATIKHQLVLLKRLFNVARKWGLYDGVNPLDSVDFPKLDNQKTEFLKDDELKRLLKVLDEWPNRESAAFIKFALLTGFRRGELFKLTWENVNLERGVVTLREPKGGKTETIPISSQAVDLLKSLERFSIYVFPGKEGKMRTDFKGPWDRIRKAADLPPDFRLHGLRHHFASTLVSNGEDLYVVGKLLSHKQSTTTQRYAHLADARLRQAAQKSGDILLPLLPSKEK
jgi:integrase/ribosomal protein L37E